MGNRRTLHKLLNQGAAAPVAPMAIVNISTKTGTNALVHNLTGVPAGALLVVSTTVQDAQVDGTVSSSPSLTWTERVDASTPQSPTAEIYTAVFTAGGSIDITTNYGAGRVQTSVVYVITGNEVVLGGNFATGLGQATSNVAVSTTKVNSFLITVTSNWNTTTALTYRNNPNQVLEHIDPANGTFAHFYYIAPTIQSYTVGYSAPNDIDLGTSTAVLEIRSGSGVIGNQAPIANAGANQTIVSPASSVSLSGSLSSDDVAITGYLWTRISGPNTPTITSPTTVNTNVTGLIVGVYVFRLQVTDAGTLSNTDDVQITVTTSNAAPVANAGTNQTITLPTSSVTLDSSASTDDVGITLRTWTRTSGPNTPTIVTPNGVTTNVTGLIAGTYIFRITVQDAGLLTDFDEVQIVVNNIGNSAPSAPALSSTGHDQTSVSLAWSASTDDVGVANYRVYRNGGLINTVSAATLSYLDTGLTNNTTYTYRVEAVDTPGLFTPSNNINVTTGTVTPPTPFTFNALAGDYARYWGGPEFWGGGNGALSLSYRVDNGSTFSGVHRHRYRRFLWTDWEGPAQGQYLFNNTGEQWYLRDYIESCISQKILASFGLITTYPGQEDGGFDSYYEFNNISSAYPTYLHNLMQAEGTKDFSTLGGCWTPNYNSMNYINRLGALMVALNSFLNQTVPGQTFKYGDCVGYIDLRGIGSWGEWHHGGHTGNVTNFPGFVNPLSNPGNSGTFPSEARMIQIIDAQRLNLPSWPLATILNSFDGNRPNGSNLNGTGLPHTCIPSSVGQYIINNNNTWGAIGWRRDQWGDINDYYRIIAQETHGITGIPARWQTALVIGEPPGYEDGDTQIGGVHMRGLNADYISSEDGGNNGDQVDSQRPCMIGNSNYGYDPGCNCAIDGNTWDGGNTAIELRTAFTKMGCILRLITGGGLAITPTTLDVTLQWRNFGLNSQKKKNWQVMLELRTLPSNTLVHAHQSTFNPFNFKDTQGQMNITDQIPRAGLPTGSLQLSVRITDPANYLEPLQLGIQGRQTNGSYILTNLTL